MKLRPNTKEGRKVVIVGAGPGGLAAAMLLAKAGLDVTVLERRGRVGGRTSTIEENGFRFDLGPTFFLYPEVLRSIFQMCDRSLDNEIELMRLDPHYRLVFGSGGELDVSPDPERLRQEIGKFSPADADNLPRYMADNRKKLEKFLPILESSFSDAKDLLRPAMLRALPYLRPWASVDDDLGRFFGDPRVRLAFSFQSKYLGMSPFKCPSLFTMLSFLEYEYGVFAHSLGQMLHLRPQNRFEDLEGVYLVGGGTHPGSGLPVIFESAKITTRLMAQDPGIEPEWNRGLSPVESDSDRPLAGDLVGAA